MKPFRQRPQQRPKKSAMVVGMEAVLRAMQEGKHLDRIFLQNNLHGEAVNQLRRAAEQHHVPVNKVPVEKLNGLNVPGHAGCVAVLSRIHYQQLQDVISWVVEQGETPLFLMLDGITDIRNIGAIARSALAFGVQAIIIPDKGVGALNEDAILTSAGALEQIAVCRVGSLMKAVDELHLNGISVYASEMKAPAKVFDVNFSDPCAIVLGGEEHGIYPALMKICDGSFAIPMPGGFESLNVSVANGVILYEAMKQRQGGGK